MNDINEKSVYKKRFNVLKFIIYFIFIQFIFLIVGGLIFILSNVNTFDTNFQNKWNELYIKKDITSIERIINEYSIIKSDVVECKNIGFYKESDILYFCNNNKIFTFPNKDIKTLQQNIDQNMDLLKFYVIYSAGFGLLFLLLLLFINNNVFYKGYKLAGLSTGSKDFTDISNEISEYIDVAGVRLSHRLPSLEGVALCLIETEPDLFHRISGNIKELEIKAKSKNLDEAYLFLHILYKELQRIFYIKKTMYIKGIILELQSITSKYYTSIMSFLGFFVFIVGLNSIVYYSLFNINNFDISFTQSILTIINGLLFNSIEINVLGLYGLLYQIFISFLSLMILIYIIQITVFKSK